MGCLGEVGSRRLWDGASNHVLKMDCLAMESCCLDSILWYKIAVE